MQLDDRVSRLIKGLAALGKWGVRGLNAEIALATGYTSSYVGKVFKGQAPSDAFLISVCQAFEISKEWVLKGEGAALVRAHRYTHTSKDGMQWRFEGSRPVSELADKVMAGIAKELRMEGIVKTITVHDKDCIGCKHHEADIMLSYQTEAGGEVYDLFSSTALAEKMQAELAECLKRNAEDQHTDLEALNTPEPKDQLMARLMAQAAAPADPELPSLVSALEYRREQYGLSVAEFASVLGIAEARYEVSRSGQYPLPQSAVKRAFAIGVPAAVLLQP